MAEQDRILGYFLEEAQEHLRTIESGLANPVLLNQTAHIKEVFRAAHSIKGGAAMLDLQGVQKIGHHLEQAFKQIKDQNIPVDSQLQQSLQRGLAILSSSLEQLPGSPGPDTGLVEDPVFVTIQNHITRLKGHHPTPAEDDDYLYADPALEQVFGTYVTQKLAQFVEVCHRPQAEVVTKQELQQICQKIGSLGDSFEFLAWTNLLISCRLAINNPLNSVVQLQTVIPQAIQQAQRLLLAGRQPAIGVTPELEVLLTPNALNITRTPTAFEQDYPGKVTELTEQPWDDLPPPAPATTDTFSSGQTTSDFLFEPQMVSMEESSPPPVDDLSEFMELFASDPLLDEPPPSSFDLAAQYEADRADFATDLADPFGVDPFGADPFGAQGTPANDFAAVINPPHFDFEHPQDSALFIDDVPITDVDPQALPAAEPLDVKTRSAAAVPTAGIDWSDLLADIPSEVVMDYGEPAAPQADAALAKPFQPEPFELWSVPASGPSPRAPEPEPSQSLDPFSAPASDSGGSSGFVSTPFTDFAPNASLQMPPPAPDFDQFAIGAVDLVEPIEPLAWEEPEAALPQPTPAPADTDNTPSPTLSDLWEISDALASTPLEGSSPLPDFDELFRNDEPEIPSPRPRLLDAEDIQTLAAFDDLLSDTKVTDVNLADLEQIIRNGQAEGALEEELRLEDLADFCLASGSNSA